LQLCLVPIRNAKWLPVEIRRKKKNRMTEYKFHHNIKSKRRLWNIMSIGTLLLYLFLKECLSWYDLIEKYHWNIFYEEKIIVYNRRGYQQTIAEDQGSTETNQQQPTDITQKITNANEQHELPMNLKWVNSGGPKE
jgi:hypothetical protein